VAGGIRGHLPVIDQSIDSDELLEEYQPEANVSPLDAAGFETVEPGDEQFDRAEPRGLSMRSQVQLSGDFLMTDDCCFDSHPFALHDSVAAR